MTKKRFLVYVPERLGDALMMSPAIHALRQSNLDAYISLLAMSSLAAEVYENNPNIDSIYQFPLPECEIAKFDLMVFAHRDSVVINIFRQFKIPVVMIGEADQAQAQSQQAFDFIKLVFSPNEMLQFSGYQIFPGKDDINLAKSYLVNGHQYIGMHLGCHGINKKNRFFRVSKKTHSKVWPLERFVELGRLLQARGYKLVITGGDNEKHLADEFCTSVNDVINLVGKTNVQQLAAVTQRLLVYISSDTGAMHVACAVKTPLIALFGPTNVVRTGPYPTESFHRIISCKSLTDLQVETVLTQVIGLADARGLSHTSPINNGYQNTTENGIKNDELLGQL